ncbi:uncharacterized protein LOC141729129 [Zonotrichia albicollis]|uniref:uncharacterized protein LOC141729129 n=1 Tax=Zonotrichia albicollis TaxID=44394 RepID=UPI003D80EF2D
MARSGRGAAPGPGAGAAAGAGGSAAGAAAGAAGRAAAGFTLSTRMWGARAEAAKFPAQPGLAAPSRPRRAGGSSGGSRRQGERARPGRAAGRPPPPILLPTGDTGSGGNASRSSPRRGPGTSISRGGRSARFAPGDAPAASPVPSRPSRRADPPPAAVGLSRRPHLRLAPFAVRGGAEAGEEAGGERARAPGQRAACSAAMLR